MLWIVAIKRVLMKSRNLQDETNAAVIMRSVEHTLRSELRVSVSAEVIVPLACGTRAPLRSATLPLMMPGVVNRPLPFGISTGRMAEPKNKMHVPRREWTRNAKSCAVDTVPAENGGTLYLNSNQFIANCCNQCQSIEAKCQ